MKTATISLYIDESGSCCTLYDGDQTKAEELPEQEVAAIVGDTGEREETKLCLYIIDKALLLGYDHLVLDDSFATYSPDVETAVRFVNREKKLEAKVDADFDRLTTRQKIELGLQAAKALVRKGGEPPPPANLPEDWKYDADGPKGAGWYAPKWQPK